jgi:hypothetical protein
MRFIHLLHVLTNALRHASILTVPLMLTFSACSEQTPARAPFTALQKPATPTTVPQCPEICAKSGHLPCKLPAATCVNQCQEMLTSETCTAQMRAFLTCTQARAAQDFECGEDGEPSLKEGVCEEEQAAIGRCVELGQADRSDKRLPALPG